MSRTSREHRPGALRRIGAGRPRAAPAAGPARAGGNQSELRRLGVAAGRSVAPQESASERQAQAAADAYGARDAAPDERSAAGTTALPGHLLRSYETFFGTGLSDVRVHRDAQADVATRAWGAQALADGNDLYFAAGRYAPQDADGRHLLAHELAHVAHGDAGLLHRQEDEATLGPSFNEALAAGDDERAVRLLDEMDDETLRMLLASLPESSLLQLHGAAVAVFGPVSQRVTTAIEAAGGEALRTLDGPLGPAAGPPVSSLSAGDKLLRAAEYAMAELGPAAANELRALITPASIAAIAIFAAAYVASQVTPVGWIADLLAIAVIAASVIFLGLMIFEILRDLGTYFGAVDATTDEDLRAAGRGLARAVAKAGVGLVIALLTRGLGRGVGPPRPRPIGGFALATGPEGATALMPIAASAEEAAPSGVQALASMAVMAGPPGSAPAAGAAVGGPAPRGPEVFEQISNELGLATEEEGGASVADAVTDAHEAGFVDAEGRPTGSVDLALQSHASAPVVRSELGVSGAEANSAHIAPTSAMTSVPGYSRGRALTTLMDAATHRAFDAHWKSWAMNLRRGGATEINAGELYAEMLQAIEQIPGLSQRARNALAWRLQLELFAELGLSPSSPVTLPYPNIGP